MQYKYKTSTKKILADLYTPVGIYMRLRDLYPQSALMESSDYHGNDNSRSFIGINPMASVAVSHGEIVITYPDGNVEKSTLDSSVKGCAKEQVAAAFNSFIRHFEVEGEGKDYCGLYGYTAFNAVRYFEDIAVKDVTQSKNDAPDMLYILYKDVIVFDHFNNKMMIVQLLKDGEKDNINKIELAINKGNVKPYGFHPIGDTTSPLTDEEHKANIRRGIQHCLRGDVFQRVLSRRFIQKYEGDDFKLYRALRSINPA